MNQSLQDEFNLIVKALCQQESVKLLYTFKQHGSVNRLNHSLNVAEKSFLIGKKLGLDSKALARAGLLHDFHHSGRFSIKARRRSKVFSHALTATENAKKNFEMTDKELNIIRSHMFPLSFVLPSSKEAVVVNCIDKLSTMLELYESWFRPRYQKEKEFKVYCKYILNKG